ncbi:response regulator transcription factor [Streptomyces sp. SM14]|uniref:response regulator transcription factor n=1 Tax=Streptomyces sp. SM14 TaxID=1736045 RepID=UPI000CD5A649|nr:response regulator transcription factor [Streptomyces sp. SM14]
MDRIRALIVDRHRVFAESLATALSAEPDVRAVAAGSPRGAAQLLARAKAAGEPFQVLLADADLLPEPAGPVETVATTAAAPSGPTAAIAVARAAAAVGAAGADQNDGEPAPTGTAGLAEVARVHHPGLRLVVLASADDAETAARMLAAGALGWVAKDSSLARLLHVVRGALRDETHLPPALLTEVLRELTRDRRSRTEYQRLAESLTPRELEVLRCMLAGLGRKAVAERLYLSPHTVRTHMQNVLGKLGVHSTLAAVAVARRAGVPPVEG